MKRIIICLMLIVSMLPSAAFAADTQSVTTTRAAYFHILYNGTEQAFTDVNGAAVLPLIYDGTTYLPIRALSNLAGLKVEWIGETGTVKLTSGGTQTTYSGSPKGTTENVNVIVSSNITVTLDSAVKTFSDVNGKAVYPLNYNGTTYLPVRAICGLVNIAVDWDGAKSTVYLGTKPSATGEDSGQSAVPLTLSSTMVTDEKSAIASGYTVQKYSVSAEGFNYLRVRVTGKNACTICLYDSKGEYIAESRTDVSPSAVVPEVLFTVTGYSNIIVACIVRSGEKAGIAKMALENAVTVPTTNIPSGATALTDANTTFDAKDTTYINSQFIRRNTQPADHVPSSIIFTNSGYTVLTFTVTTELAYMKVVVCKDDTDIRLSTWQSANTATTYTIDISGLQSVNLSVYSGNNCNSIITSAYVK